MPAWPAIMMGRSRSKPRGSRVIPSMPSTGRPSTIGGMSRADVRGHPRDRCRLPFRPVGDLAGERLDRPRLLVNPRRAAEHGDLNLHADARSMPRPAGECGCRPVLRRPSIPYWLSSLSRNTMVRGTSAWIDVCNAPTRSADITTWTPDCAALGKYFLEVGEHLLPAELVHVVGLERAVAVDRAATSAASRALRTGSVLRQAGGSRRGERGDRSRTMSTRRFIMRPTRSRSSTSTTSATFGRASSMSRPPLAASMP